MSEDAERWKEKYLNSIDQQDKLERRWNARLDLLRRGLVRSSLAAEGSDRAVDQCMKELREVVRRDDMDAGLAALLPRLEKAVLDSEQRRETRVGQMGSALNELVNQLQKLPLPRDVSRPLKNFAKKLDDRVSQARELPLLLSELSGLQRKALALLDNPEEHARPGLLQRLFGGRDAVSAEVEPTSGAERAFTPIEPLAQPVKTHHEESVPPVQVQSAQTPPRAIDVSEPESEPEPALALGIEDQIEAAATPEPEEHAPTVASLSVDDGLPPVATPVVADAAPIIEVPGAATELIEQRADALPDAVEPEAIYDLPASPEPSYSSVATHIEETLLSLLDDLTLPEHHRPQAEAMRARLAGGLNWYELLPILDDLAVLMLAITDSGQHDFEVYLKQLNERLESFQSNLQSACEGHSDNRSVARDLQNQLREQVGGLQSSVQEAADLSSLKQVLESRLEGLLGTMDQHQQQRDQREQEVAARLQNLASRVVAMEQEAQGFRVHLEEQRQKALIDPLTGLPNRAAWSERMEQEAGRWPKNENGLLLGMLDLDHFKRINDNYGHLAGDKVLKIIANELRKRLRPSDFIARFGGEKFVLLIPDTDRHEGLALMNTLRKAIEACPFHFKGEPVTITVSMGATAFRTGEDNETLLKRANEALYRAKEEGRNRVKQG